MPGGGKLRGQGTGQGDERALVAEYVTSQLAPRSPQMEEMLTMQPSWAWSMAGRTAWMAWNAPVHVDGEVAMPQVVGDVLKQRLTGHAGVVHQQRHRAENILQAANHVVDLGAVGHVGPQGQGAAAGGSELRHQAVGAVLPDAVIHAHGVAVGSQLAGHGPANTAGSARHQRDLFHTAHLLVGGFGVSIANFLPSWQEKC